MALTIISSNVRGLSDDAKRKGRLKSSICMLQEVHYCINKKKYHWTMEWGYQASFQLERITKQALLNENFNLLLLLVLQRLLGDIHRL